MVSRLVLGCGSLGRDLVGDLATGGDRLRVLASAAERVEMLRDAAVPAERVDVTDPAAIDDRDPVDLVLVAGDAPSTNVAAAAAAATAYPAATLLAYVGVDASAADREALRGTADRVIDPGEAVLAHVAERATDPNRERVRRLRETLCSIDGRLGVFTHDNPDPDAIASAIALVRIAESVGVPASACYYGEISHQENRALVNLLDLDLRKFDADDPDDDPATAFAAVAIVDHARPGVNDMLPPDADVRIVVDHHPVGDEASVAAFEDRRDDVGATSTLLAGYVPEFDVDLADGVATGLLYGIRVDTAEFTREVTVADLEAAAALLPHVDRDVLARVESPQVTGDTLDTFARAVRTRELRGSALVSCVGAITDRDALAQAADDLLGLTGVTVTIVAGFTGGTVYVSGRARGDDADLGETLRRAFDDVGSAGGHVDMAGAQLPLGLFDAIAGDLERELSTIVCTHVAEAFFAALEGDAVELPVEAAAVDRPVDGERTHVPTDSPSVDSSDANSGESGPDSADSDVDGADLDGRR